MSKRTEWIVQAVLGALLTIIVGLLAFIGTEKISSLDRKNEEFVKQIQGVVGQIRENTCKLNTLTVKDRLENFEAQFLGHPMDDLTLNSAELVKLKGFESSLSPLEPCSDAQDFRNRVKNMHDGLVAYIGRDFDAAIDRFILLPTDRAVTNQLLASTYYHKSLRYPPDSDQAKNFAQQADSHSQQFISLADNEIGGILKQAEISRYDCNTKSRRSSDQVASRSAITCLQGLIDKKIADHNTYYNLAAINSRLGNCKAAIDNLKLAADADVHREIARTYILHDDDFASMSKSSDCSQDWEKSLSQFH